MWRFGVIVPEAAVPAFEAAFTPLSEAVSALETADGGWCVAGIAKAPPDRVAIDIALALAAAAAGIATPLLSVGKLAETDWVAHVHADMPAVTAGRFTVYGRHLSCGVARGHIGLKIDAAQAFGSGHHASTAGCLLGLSRLAGRPVGRALDLGCGSGVLAIAIAKLWHAAVTAADIDPRAVEETAANARRNGVKPWLRTIGADGISAAVRRAGPFDLIVANILARPLKRLAADIVTCLGERGHVILAGFLTENARDVQAAYAARGLALAFRLDEGGWTTLVLRR
jgi:ribosomal protein L11 methyltransferase